jgi:DNA-binding MurR/RpiR family transcriptional regulator
MGQDDAILAISFTPYQSAVVRAAKTHAARGGIVIGVTDTVLSPLAGVARVIVEVPQQMPITAHPLVMGTCILQALAISVGETRGSAPHRP